MTLIPQFKKCSKCKRVYSWNPDVGMAYCPRCGSGSLSGIGDIPGNPVVVRLFGKKKGGC